MSSSLRTFALARSAVASSSSARAIAVSRRSVQTYGGSKEPAPGLSQETPPKSPSEGGSPFLPIALGAIAIGAATTLYFNNPFRTLSPPISTSPTAKPGEPQHKGTHLKQPVE